MTALRRTSVATPSFLAAASPAASVAARRSAASTRAADSCAMLSMTSAYAFLSASTCAKEETIRPRGGRTDGGGRVPGAEFHLGGSHFGKLLGGEEERERGALVVARALVCCGARRL
jgi:hypothetical protein